MDLMEEGHLFDYAGENCVFCKVISKEKPSFVVYEDKDSLAFLDHNPLFPGHCLLVPKKHYETVIDLPADLVLPIFKNVQLLARAVEKGLEAEGSFVAINNRISQSVPHLHIHVVPRRRGDGLKGFFWPRHPYKDQSAILRIQSILRSTIIQLQS